MRARENLLGLNFGPKWSPRRRFVMRHTDDSKRVSRPKREIWIQPTATTPSTIFVGWGKITRGPYRVSEIELGAGSLSERVLIDGLPMSIAGQRSRRTQE